MCSESHAGFDTHIELELSCLWVLVSSPLKWVQSPPPCRAPWLEVMDVRVLGNRVAASNGRLRPRSRAPGRQP